MQRLKLILSGVLFFAGTVLAAGGAEVMNYLCIGAGIGCVALGAWLVNRLEAEGALGEGDEDGED